MKATKKGIAAALASVLLALSLAGAFGCAPAVDDAELIRQDLASELDETKHMDDATYRSMIEVLEASMGGEQIVAVYDAMGVSTEDMLDAMLDGFDYEIGDIEVKGDEAVAPATITARNLTQMVSGFYEVLEDVQSDPEQFIGLTEEEVYSKLGGKVKEMFASVPLIETDMDFDYEKKDGKWQMSSASEVEFSKVFFE